MPNLSGVTRSANGTPLAGVTVKLFLSANDTLVSTIVSGSDGAFSFAVATAGPFYLLGYKAGSPDLSGTTINSISVFIPSAAPPVITTLADHSVTAGSPYSLALTANEAVVWSISGPDAALWDVGTDTLGAAAFDFNAPADVGANNVYNLTLRATSVATGLTTDLPMSFTVTAPADVTAPILSSPTGAQTGTTTATLGVTTDEANGTLYSFVSTSATPPSAATLKAGTGAVFANSQTITTTGAKTASATGLTASTAYYVHWLHRDAAGNDSGIVSSASFTTAGAGITDSTNHGAGPNLFAAPSDFSDAAWGTASLGVTANVDGEYDLLYPTSSGGYRFARQSLTVPASTPLTLCFDVEAAGINFVALDGGQPMQYAFAYIDLTTGVVYSKDGPAFADVLPLGGTKYRCRLQRSSGTGGLTEWVYIYPCDAGGSADVTASGTNGIKVRNAYFGTT